MHGQPHIRWNECLLNLYSSHVNYIRHELSFHIALFHYVCCSCYHWWQCCFCVWWEGETFQNITKLGSKKKLINSVINNPATFGLTSRTATHMTFPLSCTVIDSIFTAIDVSFIHKTKQRYVYVSSSDTQRNGNQWSTGSSRVSIVRELALTDKTH